MKVKNKNNKSDIIEKLFLVKFILPKNKKPVLYTLITSGGDTDRPLAKKNKIIFFENTESAEAAIKKADPEFSRIEYFKTEHALICDIPKMLYLIEKRNEDRNATIINCLNSIFDLVSFLKIKFPSNYKNTLFKLADHLTFHRSYGNFLKRIGIDRSLIIEAINWCIKAIFSNPI